LRLPHDPGLLADLPRRAEVLLDAIRAAQLGPVTEAVDHGLDPILAVHDPAYVQFLRTVYRDYQALFGGSGPVFPDSFAVRPARARPNGLMGRIGHYAFAMDSPILQDTWIAAYWSAQTALTAADALLAGERLVYALCRPPGHHAAADLYGGFSYLNNAAIAARSLQRAAPGTTPIAILDLDYHHGNGTQSIFYADPSVFYCSLHADPDDDFPYFWGAADERGTADGEGYTRNWPLPAGTDDDVYLQALNEAVAEIRAFAPRYVLISLGFDLVLGDPVPDTGFRVTTAGVAEIGRRVASLDLPTCLVQEGGYLLESLGDNLLAFLSSFRH
jgi:acetoin utilization deacetylase AcuC-like enzyme